MRVAIDAKPGELEARLDEVLATIREMAGGELCKADPEPAAGDHGPRPFDDPVLEELLQRMKRRHVERIQRIMQRRIGEVVARAATQR